MTAREVSSLLQQWLGDEHVKWEGTPEVVPWARGYGCDLRRAWAEAPRADFLMAIAGACLETPEIIVPIACKTTRPALAFVPRKETRPLRALHLAETRLPGRQLHNFERVTAAAMAVFDQIQATVAHIDRERQATAPRFRAAFGRIIDESVLDAAHQPAARRETPEDFKRRALRKACGDFIEATSTDPVLRAAQALGRKEYQQLAFAHAARACAACLTVASSADLAERALAFLGLMSDGDRPADESALDSAAAIALRCRARVFTEAALVFSHVARAYGAAAAASDHAWLNGMQTFGTVMHETVATDSDASGAPHEALKATLQAYSDNATEAKQLEFADLVRTAVPFSMLNPSLYD